LRFPPSDQNEHGAPPGTARGDRRCEKQKLSREGAENAAIPIQSLAEIQLVRISASKKSVAKPWPEDVLSANRRTLFDTSPARFHAENSVWKTIPGTLPNAF
jgi:hypothetical protein